LDIDHIRQAWLDGEVEFTLEANERLEERNISAENIGEAILSGRITEEHRGVALSRSAQFKGLRRETLLG